MLRRKNQKRRGPGGDGGRPPQGRRTPPPESTGLEAKYLQRIQEKNATLVVHLRDGRTVEGLVEESDRNTIVIKRAEGGTVVIRKSDVRYLSGND